MPDLQPEEVTEEKDKAKKTLPYYFNKEKERSANKDKSKDDHSDKKDRDRERDKHKKHDHKDKHKSRKHRRRSSEREKHRSRSRKRSRSGHRRSKSPEKERRRSTSTEKSSHRSRSVEKSHRSDKDSHRSHSKKRRSRSRSRRKEKSAERNDTKVTVETAASVKEEKSVEIEEDKVPADLLNPFKSVDVDLSDMEPTSTVTIKTPPYAHSPETPSYIWKGTLIMPDVPKFHTTLKEVSGNCEGLDEDLQSVIDCVGRIHPNTVWDYISKVKKTGNKEILVLRFESSETEDRNNYFSLYSYLSRKNRMAVVGNTGPAIKDFYVMPLAGHSPVPQVLLPLDGPGFEDCKPHLLLAVVVRSRRRKYHTSSIVSQPSTSQIKKIEHEPYVPMVPHLPQQSVQEDSFTPPHSPTSVFVNTQVPITTTAASTY